MRKKVYEKIAKCHEKLLLVDFDPDRLDPDEIDEISKLSQKISKRAIELRERAQTAHKNAKVELEALRKVVNEFLASGKYNEKTLPGIIHILVIDPGFVSEDRIKRIKTLNGLPLLFVLLGMERTSLGKMRQNPFNNLMSLISEITIDESIPDYARKLDEFLRMPDKSYLDIKSGMILPLSKRNIFILLQKLRSTRRTEKIMAIWHLLILPDNEAGPFSLKRKRKEEGTEYNTSTSKDTPINSANLCNLTSTQASPASTKVGRQPQASHLNSLELSLVTTVQPEAVMQSQTPPGGPYATAVTKAQGSSFLSGSAVSSKQTSASNPVQIMTITTSEGSYDLEVDVLAASRAADEKRSRNAGASARFRQRRKEKENEADNRIKELEQERDFYRGDRDRLRDVVFNTPGLKHHARWRPSSPQAMPSASFQELMPQTAHSQPISQTAFQVKHPTSQRTSKRRRTDTRGGYTSTNDCPPTTTLTPMQSFSPQSTLPSAKTASKTLLPRATWSQGFDHHVIGIYRQEWPGDRGRGQQNRYSTLSSCVGRTNHLPTSTLCNFPSSDQPSYAFRRMNSAVI